MQFISFRTLQAALILTLAATSSWAHGLLPREGNYRNLLSENFCDVHIETNAARDRLFLTEIANQRTGERCTSSVTKIFICDRDGDCELESDENVRRGDEVTIIDAENFVFNSYKYTFIGRRSIRPPSHYRVSGWFGYKSALAHSFRDREDCVFESSEGPVGCDDTVYAKDIFCPRARDVAIRGVLELCEDESGRRCEFETQAPVLDVRRSRGHFRRGHFEYTATLTCTVEALAWPID
jgi:hypothetical protein